MMMSKHTLDKLSHWHKKLFKKLGWMVLSKDHKNTQEISSYKRELIQFMKAANQTIMEYEENDRKHDIKIMMLNVKCLRDFVNKKL